MHRQVLLYGGGSQHGQWKYATELAVPVVSSCVTSQKLPLNRQAAVRPQRSRSHFLKSNPDKQVLEFLREHRRIQVDEYALDYQVLHS